MEAESHRPTEWFCRQGLDFGLIPELVDSPLAVWLTIAMSALIC